MPSISVVIPTCDRPQLLARALRSVMAQTAPPDEIVVADNGTVPVEPAGLPCPVVLARLAPRIGASHARNAGARRAQGEYVAFLDDDDEWDARYLEHMAEAISARRPRADLLYGRKDLVIDGRQERYKCLTEEHLQVPALLLRNPGAGGTNCVARRAAFLELGGFDTRLVASEDRALALDFLLAGKMLAAVPEAVARVHRGRGDHLSHGATFLQGRRQFLRKYKRVMGWREWLLAHANLMAVRAEHNADRRLLSKAQERAGLLLSHLAGRFPPLKQTRIPLHSRPRSDAAN